MKFGSLLNFVTAKMAIPTIFIVIFFSFISLIKAQDTVADDDPVAIFNQGQDAHEKGDLKTAIELYQKALKILPQFPEAELQLGNALLASGKTSDAEIAYRHAVELRPDWPLAATSLGGLLVAEKKYSEAEPLLAKSIEADERNFDALTAMAELLVQTKAKPEAMLVLLGKIKVQTGKANPSSNLWAARGSLESHTGNVADAKKSIEQALALNPKNKTALFEKANIALKENDLTTAEATAAELEKLTNNSEAAVSIHAQALFDQGKTDEAKKLIDSIASPSKETLGIKNAMAASASENPADLEASLANDPKNASILTRLCSLYRVPAPAKALDYCKRAFDADPTNIKPAIGYGAALVQAKRNDEAIQLFRKILAIAPDNSTTHSNLATALFETKRYAEAKTEYEWLTAKQPDLAAAYFFLAICHDQLREYLDAMANYQQFLKLADPGKQQLEIDKVNLRLPSLQQQIKKGAK